MIIGNGLIAHAFKNSSYVFDDCIIFASGISDSKSDSTKEFQREFNLLSQYIKEDKKFIYFSSIHILDPSEKDSMYVQHKLNIEEFIRSNFLNYIIYRLPVIVGKGGNSKALFNFLFNSIVKNIEMTIYLKSYRYILDVHSVVYFVNQTLHIQNKTINLVADKAFSILEILQLFEKYLNKKAKFIRVDKGDYFEVDNTEFKDSLLDKNELTIYSNYKYIEDTIRKYY